MKFLRGTPADLFGWSAHRRQERELIAWYEDLIRRVLDRYDETNVAAAIDIASLPDQIRGYEHIKEKSITQVKKAASDKLAAIEAAALAHSAR
jgi:indolepyruvate ferredoxin oxidoreductase